MPTNLDRMVGSNVSLLLTESHNLLITWSQKVIKQMKKVINSFSRDLWIPKLTEGRLLIRSHMFDQKATFL